MSPTVVTLIAVFLIFASVVGFVAAQFALAKVFTDSLPKYLAASFGALVALGLMNVGAFYLCQYLAG